MARSHHERQGYRYLVSHHSGVLFRRRRHNETGLDAGPCQS